MIHLLTWVVVFFAVQNVFAADNFLGIPRFKGVNPVTNIVYQDNCADCHMAYAPGLLPARSWKKLMDSKALEDHFGDNAEMDENDRREILHFLTHYAANSSYYKRSTKIVRSLNEDATPLRITQVPYIKRKHSEIPARLINGNKKVRSLSYCDNCHTQTKKGVFDDDTVFIPGYGEWDD